MMMEGLNWNIPRLAIPGKHRSHDSLKDNRKIIEKANGTVRFLTSLTLDVL